MRKSRKIISMPIISIGEGTQLGSVKGLVVNPAKKEVAALVVDQKGWFREEKIIPYNKVSHIGDDAITVDQSSNAEKPTNLPEILKLLREKNDPIGMKVISETGKVLGHAEEYYINELTGDIVALEIAGKLVDGILKGKSLLDANEILTIGSDAIVVRKGTENSITKIDGGLQETFANLKDSTSSLWNTTRQKTIEISKSLKEKTKEKVKSVRENNENEPIPTVTEDANKTEVSLENEDVLKAEAVEEQLPENLPAETKVPAEDKIADDRIADEKIADENTVEEQEDKAAT